MYSKIITLFIVCMFFTVAYELHAQELEVDGAAKIGVMDAASESAKPVGREADGTLVEFASHETTYSVGDYAQGGVVFWVTASGKHGRVVSIYNIAGVPWSLLGTEIGGSAQSTLHGAGNSVAITAQAGHTISAAEHCLDLAFAGYDDWYLPAINELNQVYMNRVAIDSTASANGGEAFIATGYWSSTESDDDSSEALNKSFFGAGTQQPDGKSAAFHVRAIRAF